MSIRTYILYSITCAALLLIANDRCVNVKYINCFHYYVCYSYSGLPNGGVGVRGIRYPDQHRVVDRNLFCEYDNILPYNMHDYLICSRKNNICTTHEYVIIIIILYIGWAGGRQIRSIVWGGRVVDLVAV